MIFYLKSFSGKLVVKYRLGRMDIGNKSESEIVAMRKIVKKNIKYLKEEFIKINE